MGKAVKQGFSKGAAVWTSFGQGAREGLREEEIHAGQAADTGDPGRKTP